MTIKTKFNIGDEVWHIYGYAVQKTKILYHGPKISVIEIGGREEIIPSHVIFKTKEELIESLFN